MSWLQQRPQTSDPTNYYTVGMNKTILLVGLGNIDEEYDLTRHNIGFKCLDDFVTATPEMEKWVEKKSLKSHISTGRLGENRVIAIKPTTFMNLSGEAVQAVSQFYKLSSEHIVVVHDELDIEFGQIRNRVGGSAAGHNGIKSVSQHLGENYGRIRIGIGPKPERIKSESFVLKKFSASEQKQLSNLTTEVTAIINEYLFGTELPHDTRSFIV
ncbi:MAG: aminoacyl-tRNA hydrolase [Patescibacteria group bacterium]|nr:aminoacyl-tRNA hydrolase [Patescibacteria group bacterium]